MKDSVIIGQVSPYSIDPNVFAVELYFTGCHHRCKKCHNPDLWNYMPEHEKTLSSLVERLSDILSHGLVKEIHFLGGEPLLNMQRALFIAELIRQLKERFPDVKFVLFTGFEMSHVESLYPFVLDLVDYIKTGKYDVNCAGVKRLHDNFMLATKNQKLWHKTKEGFHLVL